MGHAKPWPVRAFPVSALPVRMCPVRAFPVRACLRRALPVRALLAVALLVLAGCAAQYRNHGYIPPEEELAQIEVGLDTRDSVAQLIGRPAATGVLDVSGWYYVQSRYRQFAYQAPEEIDRQVVAISFDDRGFVENVERFGLEDGRVVVLSRRVTDDNVKGITFLRQLFGNLGRIDATRLFDNG